MMTSDFYKILNVKKTATDIEIKQSYKKLVLKYHQDRNKKANASEIFKKIQIAYETLSNPDLRKKYDCFDLMNHSTIIKNIFMIYQELIIEICDKYDLTITERQEIINLFDPKDFEIELLNNDMDAANQKLTNKIFSYLPKFAMRRISMNYPYLNLYLESIINYIF